MERVCEVSVLPSQVRLEELRHLVGFPISPQAEVEKHSENILHLLLNQMLFTV